MFMLRILLNCVTKSIFFLTIQYNLFIISFTHLFIQCASTYIANAKLT